MCFDDRTIALEEDENHCLNFKQKNVYSMKNNPMCGVTLSKWASILYKYWQYIEIQYIPRVIFITIMSIVNSALSFVENFLYGASIQSQQLPDNPVFIIGHPRTGTTLIHNLLSSDESSFYYCTTFCAGFPSSFIWFEKYGKRLFSSVIEKTRPMDSMPLHFDLPQEDECATNVLSGGVSYYMPLWLMKQEPEFRRYLDFSPTEGGNPQDEAQWTASFTYLLKKLSFRAKRNNSIGSRRLLIKSPVHTARVPLLRKLFPRAQFIYVHR